MLGTRCAAAGGVLVLNRLRTGATIALLPLFPVLRIRFAEAAPRERAGEWKAGEWKECVLVLGGAVKLLELRMLLVSILLLLLRDTLLFNQLLKRVIFLLDSHLHAPPDILVVVRLAAVDRGTRWILE